ncbi:MAG: methylated-DNA--[protein]-cysteine S-methyltransferase [Syntrophomonadaceae bacterium]|nr:methylated-DNA--[protein]-cysteine S-methyltransferase [Syntrophomonadaceae bacterium]
MPDLNGGSPDKSSWLKELVVPVDLVDSSIGPEYHAADRMAMVNHITRMANQLAYDLNLYLAGEDIDFSIPLDWSGYTSFQRRVLTATSKIPRGTTRSYREVAEIIGNYRAARAVGQALRSNRVPLLVPCHRVITSQGTLGGFTGGLEWKRWLLALEGVWDLH